MLQIVILCVAALFVGNCESAELQILINGMSIERNASCIKENVAYICNFQDSNSHTWTVPGIFTPEVLNVATVGPIVMQGYTLRVVSVVNNNLETSLSVDSFAGLNGTNISCLDGSIQNGEVQDIVAIVLAPPSLPELDVNQVMEDNETVHIMVTPPSVSPECVLDYDILIYSNCEGIETNITIDPNTDPTQPVEMTKDGFNLCTCSYNFTAAAVTRNGTGERSDPVTIKISDIVGNPNLTITNDGFKVRISINPQEPSVFVDVKHGIANDTNCVMNVERNRSITSSETTLDCSFAEHTPTFCVQFIDGSCQSELVLRTTTKLPSLLSGVKINSSTSSIVVIVDVNESINCDTSQLSTRTTISDESRVISMNTSDFKDLVIVFEPQFPGVYTCNISIMSGNATLKSMETACNNMDARSDSSTSTVPIIVGCVVGILAVLILIIVIVVLVKKGCCERCSCESCEECCSKEKKTSSHSNNNANTTSITMDRSQDTDPNSTDGKGKHKDPLLSMYQDPNSIKHEAAAGGEVYTMVEKKPKTKKGKEENDDVAAMYSMPDKSKKNPELMYADVQVSNPQHPPNNRGIGNRSVFQQDTSSVTYASVESPTTKF